MKKRCILLAMLISTPALAGIPATPVLTYYQFGGGREIPYYRIEDAVRSVRSAPAGSLALGSSIIPCLVVRNGRPITDAKGYPLIGFELVVDARTAGFPSSEKFKALVAERKALVVDNHHCSDSVKYVIDVREFLPLEKAPFFSAPVAGSALKEKRGEAKDPTLDDIVRAFHASPQCEEANRNLMGRRVALERAWERFIEEKGRAWSAERLERAKHLDYTMRTVIYEGHLDRGCSAYGTCERNIIALSIRNRGTGSCSRGQGCRFPGDFQGVASKVSQYNIWDEFLTQISGLTACYLRPRPARDLVAGEGDDAADAYYRRIRSMYEQNVADVERILYGDDADLAEIFPGTPLGDLTTLRHYYHAPAMKKCFPAYPRAAYVSVAVARAGDDYALLVNKRIHVDAADDGGYRFRDFVVEYLRDRDDISLVDRYPGFVVDGKAVRLKGSGGCPPYGIPRGCAFKEVGRYRRTPSWFGAGRPVGIQCRVEDRGESCMGSREAKMVSVGGRCDIEMRPVAGVR